MKTTINGIELAYTDDGRGLPVVFLHAFPLGKAMWEPQVRALSGACRVITVDLRGHGESGAPLWRYTVETFADDVKELLDHLDLQQVVLAGLSMGGYVCFAFYRKYADRVKAFILSDTRAPADSPEGKAGRFAMAQVAYTQGPSAIADAMLPKLLGETSLHHRPELVESVRRIITRNQVSGIAGDLMAMEARPDSVPLLPSITCPTLVLVGDEDVATPPAEARLMAERIPGARLTTIPGAGHLANLEQPEAFNRAVADFVASLPT